ncbi:MAG: peptidoglycan editing factor PgeF [Nocardioidaceae bacterium]
MFAFQDSRDRIDVAFTDRHGGTSGGPYASLNLAEVDATHREEVAENVRLAARALTGAEPPVLRMRQVHGSDVHVVVSVDDAVPVADAMVTARPGVVLMVRVADCVPVVLADAGRGIVGVAHAGRPGMAAGVVPNTVAAMRDLGAADLVAWVGPHVCGRCYEVPAEMRAEVSALVPEAYAETSWGTAALDIGAGVRAQLRSAGVAVVDAARCTVEDEDLYSYRRQGKQSGRMAGLVWARP